ncbi:MULTISPECIES: hypothetical protein [unclassified Bradyrhizobium]|uniref:hypothetical protein n=1 Tax=unclassified Bradyrhizobium TaxID=2631580 RepID=UPI003395148B
MAGQEGSAPGGAGLLTVIVLHLEAVAADESDSSFKVQLLAQAQSYRKLAAKRAAEVCNNLY